MAFDAAERINNRLPIPRIKECKTTMGALLLSYDKDPDETKTPGGIIIKQVQDLFLVTAVVEGVSDMMFADGRVVPPTVKIGDVVTVERRSGIILGEQADKRFYKVVMPKDIILIHPK